MTDINNNPIVVGYVGTLLLGSRHPRSGQLARIEKIGTAGLMRVVVPPESSGDNWRWAGWIGPKEFEVKL